MSGPNPSHSLLRVGDDNAYAESPFCKAIHRLEPLVVGFVSVDETIIGAAEFMRRTSLLISTVIVNVRRTDLDDGRGDHADVVGCR